jgi:hypothetical protein
MGKKTQVMKIQGGTTRSFKGMGKEGEERLTYGVNMIKVHYMHVWNITMKPLTLYK